jgi:hypothetical protein
VFPQRFNLLSGMLPRVISQRAPQGIPVRDVTSNDLSTVWPPGIRQGCDLK